MTDDIAVVFVSGFYDDVDHARSDSQAVKDLYYEINAPDDFDAVVIGKQDTGDVKIFKKHDQPARPGRMPNGGWGLAGGLAAALYPAVAIGTGLLVGSPEGATGLMGIGGSVAGALGRERLLKLGEGFDRSEAGLIVAAGTGIEPLVRAVLGRTVRVRRDETVVNLAHLERTVRDARREAVA